MRSPIKPFVVMAMNNTFRGQDWDDLRSINKNDAALECRGVYKGQSERSWIVPIDDMVYDLAMVESLAILRNQESILVVREDRSAYLKFLDGSNETKEVGTWRNVRPEVARNSDCYTEISEGDTAGKFYITL